MVIRPLGADKGTGAEMSPAVINGIVTADVPVSYWPIFFPLSLVTDPEISSQFPSPVSKVANRLDHTA